MSAVEIHAIAEYLNIIMFVTVSVLLMLGFPVAFTLAGVALLFAVIGDAMGVFRWASLNFYPQRLFGIMSNDVVVAAPLFIFMGLMLERSKVAEDLLTAMAQLFQDKPGGLVISVTLVGALLAASTGIVGATVVAMGLISLPVMLRYGYSKSLACGTIAASGTLGQIIPPSLVLVFLGDILTYANQQANLRMGRITGTSVGVGDLFAGALLPGLMLVGLYIAYQLTIAVVRPQMCPPVPASERIDTGESRLRILLRALLAPFGLIVAVLGSILGGIATPTEAAAVGAVGATLLAAARTDRRFEPWLLVAVAASSALVVLHFLFDVRIARDNQAIGDQIAIALSSLAVLILAVVILRAFWIVFGTRTLHSVTYRTARITAMVFTILIGASLFTLVFRGLEGEETVQAILQSMPGGRDGAILFVMVVMFFMGMFLDFLEICFIVVPVVAPALIAMGADPVWLGILMAVNLQTSFLSPPFGAALFFLRGVAPPEISSSDIHRGVVPYLALQSFGVFLVWSFPVLATWLPSVIYG